MASDAAYRAKVEALKESKVIAEERRLIKGLETDIQIRASGPLVLATVDETPEGIIGYARFAPGWSHDDWMRHGRLRNITYQNSGFVNYRGLKPAAF